MVACANDVEAAPVKFVMVKPIKSDVVAKALPRTKPPNAEPVPEDVSPPLLGNETKTLSPDAAPVTEQKNTPDVVAASVARRLNVALQLDESTFPIAVPDEPTVIPPVSIEAPPIVRVPAVASILPADAKILPAVVVIFPAVEIAVLIVVAACTNPTIANTPTTTAIVIVNHPPSRINENVPFICQKHLINK